MECKLLAPTPDAWRAYGQLLDARRYPFPVRGGAPSTVFVAYRTDGPAWMASGAIVYPVDTRFVCIDHFVTNPSAPLRARRNAALYTLRAAQTLATLMGRTVVIHARASKGLKRFAVRHGFTDDPQAAFAPAGLRLPWQMFAKQPAPPAPLPAGPVELPEAAPAKVAKRARKGKR